jgi:hypothetical protein
MPTIDIDIGDFLWNCSKQDIKDLIEALAENEHLPKGFLNHKGKLNQEYTGKGRLEEDFSDKLDKLKDKYYSLTSEEEEFFERIFKKYL